MNLPEPQTLVKHDRSSPPEPQTLAKHDKSSLPEPESSIYSSNPAQIQLRSIGSPHEVQTQLKSIHAHFMPTQSRAICSHNLPRLSRSPLIRSHDGSAAAAAAHKSAALSAPSEWRVTAFQIEADTLASSSSFLALKTSKDVFSGADFGTTSRTSISCRISTVLCKKATAP